MQSDKMLRKDYSAIITTMDQKVFEGSWTIRVFNLLKYPFTEKVGKKKKNWGSIFKIEFV